jgi:hypothetical protein
MISSARYVLLDGDDYPITLQYNIAPGRKGNDARNAFLYWEACLRRRNRRILLLEDGSWMRRRQSLTRRKIPSGLASEPILQGRRARATDYRRSQWDREPR